MAAYTAGFMTHVTCMLTAKNWDQLRNLTLGNRVWDRLPFFHTTYNANASGPIYSGGVETVNSITSAIVTFY